MSMSADLKPLPLSAAQGKGQFIKQHRKAVLLVGVAFMCGMVGANLWFARGHTVPMPEAAVELAPIPVPLVAGRDPSDRPLPPAPNNALIEQTAEGRLPTTAKNGLTPVLAYGYPFDRTNKQPKISLVLMDVGMQATLLNTAMRKLPGSVGLAYSPYTPNLDQALATARQNGHETLLMVPADGLDTSSYDPGPGALRNSLSADENIQRLHLMMGRAFGYVGVLMDPRGAVLSSASLTDKLITDLRGRGLELLATNDAFIEQAQNKKALAAPIMVQLDRALDSAAIDTAFAEAEQRARETGHAITVTALYPYMLDKLDQWLPTLADKGIVIAPVSAAVTPPTPMAEPESTPSTEEPGHTASNAHSSQDTHEAPTPAAHGSGHH